MKISFIHRFLCITFYPQPPTDDNDSFDEITKDWSDPGWTLTSACSIWKRMFGVLGNISHIKNPVILAETVKCIEEVWKKLNEVSS